MRQQNSRRYLQQTDNNRFDCIYLDPMFPVHKSRAKPGKELQLLQLLTENTEIEETFAAALDQPVSRVVVKRPLHAPCIADRQPDIRYSEKTIRFDVYLN